ncbi:Arm DNA-binding domain-containing protein [Novosphingobium sp. BL-8H]|uniref:Arm DNA-binding domain-containing protein n=1 Tax=Novosphingobium sp. BL-8H TaxID=3127640 RepID=UPI0037571A28
MATLFATAVASAKSRDKDYKLSDCGGLYLLVRPNGSKLWRLNYTYLGKQRTLAFGPWPEISLADARVRREEAKRFLASGVDPLHQKKVDAARARVEEREAFRGGQINILSSDL